MRHREWWTGVCERLRRVGYYGYRATQDVIARIRRRQSGVVGVPEPQEHSAPTPPRLTCARDRRQKEKQTATMGAYLPALRAVALWSAIALCLTCSLASAQETITTESGREVTPNIEGIQRGRNSGPQVRESAFLLPSSSLPGRE